MDPATAAPGCLPSGRWPVLRGPEGTGTMTVMVGIVSPHSGRIADRAPTAEQIVNVHPRCALAYRPVKATSGFEFRARNVYNVP